VNNCDTTEAAQLAADVLGIDYRAEQTDPAAASQRRSNWKLTASSVSRSASNRQQRTQSSEGLRLPVCMPECARVSHRANLITCNQRADRVQLPGYADGSLLLPLVDESGAVVAAQTITPQGEKRLLTGSAKRGAYHAVNAPGQPQR
jgi:putative DNA primase/helicase